MLARLWLLFERPLWFDELFTVWASRLSLPALIRALVHDSGPPLFYVLEKPVVIAGERLLSTDRAARLLPFGATIALFAGAFALPAGPPRRRFLLLAAASPLFLLYAAEARAYALLALLAFLLFLLALVLPERRSVFAGIALASAAALYTHYLALFVVGALLVVCLAERRWSSAAALAGGAALFAFWAPIMAAQPLEAVAWMQEPPAGFVAGLLSAFGGAGRIPAPFAPPLPPALAAFGAVAATAAAVGVGLAWRRDESIRRASAFLVIFVGAVLAASAFRPIGFAGRTEMAVLPVWLWTLASAADRSRALRAATVATVLVAALSSALLLAAPRAPAAPALAMENLEAVARPGDALVAGAHFYLPALLSAERGRLRATVYPFPLEQAEHPGWSAAVSPRPEDLALVERVLSRARPGERVFFHVPPSFSETLRPILSKRGVTWKAGRTREILVLVWSRGA